MKASKRTNERGKKEHERYGFASLPYPWLLCLPQIGRQTEKSTLRGLYIFKGEKNAATTMMNKKTRWKLDIFIMYNSGE